MNKLQKMLLLDLPQHTKGLRQPEPPLALDSKCKIKNMEYLYYFENASLTLRSVDYLCGKFQMPGAILTMIHQMDGWLVKFKMNSLLNSQQDSDLRAYLNELGNPEEPSKRINMALVSLEAGQSSIDIMRHYQVVVVFHGSPQQQQTQTLRQISINLLQSGVRWHK